MIEYMTEDDLIDIVVQYEVGDPMELDWSKSETKTSPWIADKRGLMRFTVNYSASSAVRTQEVYVNDIHIAIQQQGIDTQFATAVAFPIAKGDVVRITEGSMTFIPFVVQYD